MSNKSADEAFFLTSFNTVFLNHNNCNEKTITPTKPLHHQLLANNSMPTTNYLTWPCTEIWPRMSFFANVQLHYRKWYIWVKEIEFATRMIKLGFNSTFISICITRIMTRKQFWPLMSYFAGFHPKCWKWYIVVKEIGFAIRMMISDVITCTIFGSLHITKIMIRGQFWPNMSFFCWFSSKMMNIGIFESRWLICY